MSNAVATTGILVKRGSGGSPVGPLVTVAEIVRVLPPGFSRNKIEVSTHNEGVEAYLLGILRQRDPEFTVNYIGDEDTHEQLVSDIMNNLKATWQFLLPSGVSFTGEGRLQKFELVDAPVDAAQQAECAIAWAGPVTMDTGA